MDIESLLDLRARRLSELLAERGKKVHLADKLDVHQSYVSNLCRGLKPIGDERARQIESVMGWRPFTLDREPGQEDVITWEDRDELPRDEYAFIPRYDVRTSAGNGSHVPDEQVKEQPHAYRRSFFTERGIRPEACVVVKNDGDSMEGTISDGAVMLVDTDQRDVLDGKIYVIRYDHELRTKRLYKRPGGGLIIASDSPDYPDLNITAEEAHHVEIIGRVRQSQSEH